MACLGQKIESALRAFVLRLLLVLANVPLQVAAQNRDGSMKHMGYAHFCLVYLATQPAIGHVNH